MTEIKKMRRGDEVLTKQFDDEGHQIDVTYHSRTENDEEVIIHAGNEAIVKGSDGSMSYFQLDGTPGSEKFVFREGLRLTSSDEVEPFSPSPDKVSHDLGLVESAKAMFAKVSESPEGFEEVEEDVFQV